MVGGIKGIARRPFNGDTRRGPRHAYLLAELKRRGCVPTVDRYGNIWVEKGSGSPTILYSSHLDVDPRIRRLHFKSEKSGNHILLSGILDNAVGCYINLLLAQKGPKAGKAIYVFTASEEVARNNHRSFARSAREVLRELKRRRIKPDICISIDVTYPRLLHPQSKLNWSRPYEELFDITDKTHCYLDGFPNTRPKTKKIVQLYFRRARNPKVRMRSFHGHDEACVYIKFTPSFAFGPVVYGHFDQADQTMPLSHLKTALTFLRSI